LRAAGDRAILAPRLDQEAHMPVIVLVVALLLVGCVAAREPQANGSAFPAGATLQNVVKRQFTADDFALESGQRLARLTIAYETYGTLAPGGRNAILITHGFTSSHHAAGTYASTDAAPGWWDGLIGPGKIIDTDRYFVVSSNMLGSSYGSTAPASIDPRTGKRYGPDFPAITLRDMVTAQRRLLDSLGVTHLVVVAGPSFGGYQAFQWAVTFPDFMDGIVPVVTAPKGAGGVAAVKALVDRLASDPNWNGGWYYERGGIPSVMRAMRVETLQRYGQNEVLAVTIPDPAARAARIAEMADKWVGEFDPNSLVTLRKASVVYDAQKDFDRVRAKVLYVLSRTDKLFPPSIAPAVMDAMTKSGIDARYVEIDTEFGHSGSGPEWAKWGPALRDFLARLER
jgi:homoserine O-acetyltransferase/O-succinyltransferase